MDDGRGAVLYSCSIDPPPCSDDEVANLNSCVQWPLSLEHSGVMKARASSWTYYQLTWTSVHALPAGTMPATPSLHPSVPSTWRWHSHFISCQVVHNPFSHSFCWLQPPNNNKKKIDILPTAFWYRTGQLGHHRHHQFWHHHPSPIFLQWV